MSRTYNPLQAEITVSVRRRVGFAYASNHDRPVKRPVIAALTAALTIVSMCGPHLLARSVVHWLRSGVLASRRGDHDRPALVSYCIC